MLDVYLLKNIFLNVSLRNYFVSFITILNYDDDGTVANIQ